MIRLRLTEAQFSALQCRDWSEDPATNAAWTGGRELVFAGDAAGELRREISDASSAESDHAEILRSREEPMWRGVQGAADALSNLAARISREAAKVVEKPDR